MISQYSLEELAKICSGHWVNIQGNHYFKDVQLDHRKMKKNSIYIAIKGTNHDGHKFVSKLLKKFNHAAIVEKEIHSSNIPQLIVKNSIRALQKIAKTNSLGTKAMKIAITGSVGKTSTKEMLVKILSKNKTHSNFGNLNNHIGLPLTLSQTPKNTKFLIAEMGMNKANEIKYLSKIMNPNICAITKIANSHIGNFKSLEDIAKAKSEIFLGNKDKKTAVLPRDDKYYYLLKKTAKLNNFSKIVSFGKHSESNIKLIKIEYLNNHMKVYFSFINKVSKKPTTMMLKLKMVGSHWVNNALCAIAICYALNLNLKFCVKELESFTNLNGRGEEIKIDYKNRKILIIDDSYNASPESMTAALEVLSLKKTTLNSAVLSDMLELGKHSKTFHSSLAKKILQAKIKKLVAIGPEMKILKKLLPSKIQTYFYNDYSEAIKKFNPLMNDFLLSSDSILIKGSNNSGAKFFLNNILAYLKLKHSSKLTNLSSEDKIAS